MIRKAELKDIEDIVLLTERFFKESLTDYGLSLDDITIRETIRNFIINHIVMVAESESCVVGVVGGLVTPSMFDKHQNIAQEIIWYVDKEHRSGTIGLRLIDSFENECKLNGADSVVMVHMGNLNGEILDKYYKKRNYKLLERDYIKGV